MQEHDWLSAWRRDEENAIERYQFRRNAMFVGAGCAFALAVIFMMFIQSKNDPLVVAPESLIPLGSSLILATIAIFPIKDIKACEMAITSYDAMIEELDDPDAFDDGTGDRIGRFRARLSELRFELAKRC